MYVCVCVTTYGLHVLTLLAFVCNICHARFFIGSNRTTVMRLSMLLLLLLLINGNRLGICKNKKQKKMRKIVSILHKLMAIGRRVAVFIW